MFPQVNRPEGEFDHSPSSNAEVRNEWRYKSTPLVALMLCTWTLLLYFTYLLLGSNTVQYVYVV
jgi:hypothetical protein